MSVPSSSADQSVLSVAAQSLTSAISFAATSRSPAIFFAHWMAPNVTPAYAHRGYIIAGT